MRRSNRYLREPRKVLTNAAVLSTDETVCYTSTFDSLALIVGLVGVFREDESVRL